MMYARMPELRRSDRLSRLTPIRPEAIRISPADAVRISGVAPSAIHLSTLEGRPVYRLSSAREAVTVFADSGDMLDGVTIPRLRAARSEEHTSELQSQSNLVCRLLLEKK